MENMVDDVRTMLYQLHVTCGSEHDAIRIAQDAFRGACIYAARDLKACTETSTHLCMQLSSLVACGVGAGGGTN